jgi:hypothetical protein
VSSKTVVPQPFIHGRPVQPGEFVNWEGELRTVLNRMRNGESTVVVDERHICADTGGQHHGRA